MAFFFRVHVLFECDKKIFVLKNIYFIVFEAITDSLISNRTWFILAFRIFFLFCWFGSIEIPTSNLNIFLLNKINEIFVSILLNWTPFLRKFTIYYATFHLIPKANKFKMIFSSAICMETIFFCFSLLGKCSF